MTSHTMLSITCDMKMHRLLENPGFPVKGSRKMAIHEVKHKKYTSY